MMNFNRNLLVLFNTELLDEKIIEQEAERLIDILQAAETAENFYMAHELVDRNRITSNKRKIIKASRHFRLKPFRFFINKN